MNPSPAAITTITTYVGAMSGGWSNSDAAIAATYNTPVVANPAPRATVPAPYTAPQLLACLSMASAKNIAAFPAIYQLNLDIAVNNTANVGATVALLAAADLITSSEGAAIEAILKATEPDPSYQSTIPQSLVDLGRAVDTNDVAAARAAQ